MWDSKSFKLYNGVVIYKPLTFLPLRIMCELTEWTPRAPKGASHPFASTYFIPCAIKRWNIGVRQRTRLPPHFQSSYPEWHNFCPCISCFAWHELNLDGKHRAQNRGPSSAGRPPNEPLSVAFTVNLANWQVGGGNKKKCVKLI